MKRVIVGLFFVALILVSFGFISAEENETNVTEENCTIEGETFAAYPGEGVCCEGLTAIGGCGPVDGECGEGCSGGVVCTNCGNGECGLGENICNCPDDCENETDSEMNETFECTLDEHCDEDYECEDNYCVLNEDEDNETEIEDDDEEIIDEDTEEEAVIMHEHHGAKVRALQLQKAIDRMILHAEAIVEVLEEKGEDVSVLNNIIEEMRILLEEAQNLNVEDPTENTVKDFVNIKEDAIILRKEFREEAKDVLTEEDREALRMKFSEIDRIELKEYNEKIRAEIREFNVLRLKRLGEVTGLTDVSEKVKNGEMNSLEALRLMKKEYIDMTVEDRQQIKQNIREKITAEDLKKAAAISKVKEARANAISQRAELRAAKLQEKGYGVLAARAQARSDMYEVRAQNIENIRNAIKNRVNQNA